MTVLWFLLRGEYDEAEKYYKQALEFAQRNNGRMNEAAALVQLGSLRSLQRKTEEALGYIEQALPFYQQGGYRKWLAQALTLLGRVQFDRGDDDAALKAFNEELQLGEQAGDQSQIALSHQQDSEWRSWLIAAQAKQHLSDVAAAREYAKNAEIQLSTLEQKWGSEAYNGYLARPDIQFFRKQLGQVINP